MIVIRVAVTHLFLCVMCKDMVCSVCGHPLQWDSSVDRGDIDDGVKEGDYCTIDYYSCKHCGASVEVWGCLEEEKKNFPFWNNQEDNG